LHAGIRNPIVVARQLVDEQKNGLLPLGRVPPGFLVGNGARQVLYGIVITETSLPVFCKAIRGGFDIFFLYLSVLGLLIQEIFVLIQFQNGQIVRI
jgi:hypothetical protein